MRSYIIGALWTVSIVLICGPTFAASVVETPEWLTVYTGRLPYKDRMLQTSFSVDRANVEEDSDGIVYLNALLEAHGVSGIKIGFEYEINCKTQQIRIATQKDASTGRVGVVLAGRDKWHESVFPSEHAMIKYICK